MKAQHQAQQHTNTTSMTSMPSEYYITSPTPPAPGLRRSSVSSTVSSEFSCDSSLPSTPGGSSNTSFGYNHSQKSHTHSHQSFTDTLLAMDEDTDNGYSHMIAPNLISLHQYPHPQPHNHQARAPPPHHQPQQRHQQSHHQIHRNSQGDHEDNEMSDEGSAYSQPCSRSESGESNNAHGQSYLRKSNSLGSGLDHRRPLPAQFSTYAIGAESNEICTSPQSMSYTGPTYPPPNLFEYPASSSTCNNAALTALHLCYYSSSSPSAPPAAHHNRRLKVELPGSSSKKPKGAVRLPLIVTSDEKPHICTIPACDMRFKRQEHLRRHERTHTDERPFSCDVCGKRFSRTDNLKSHRKTHMKKTGRNVFVPGLE